MHSNSHKKRETMNHKFRIWEIETLIKHAIACFINPDDKENTENLRKLKQFITDFYTENKFDVNARVEKYFGEKYHDKHELLSYLGRPKGAQGAPSFNLLVKDGKSERQNPLLWRLLKEIFIARTFLHIIEEKEIASEFKCVAKEKTRKTLSDLICKIESTLEDPKLYIRTSSKSIKYDFFDIVLLSSVGTLLTGAGIYFNFAEPLHPNLPDIEDTRRKLVGFTLVPGAIFLCLLLFKLRFICKTPPPVKINIDEITAHRESLRKIFLEEHAEEYARLLPIDKNTDIIREQHNNPSVLQQAAKQNTFSPTLFGLPAKLPQEEFALLLSDYKKRRANQ